MKYHLYYQEGVDGYWAFKIIAPFCVRERHCMDILTSERRVWKFQTTAVYTRGMEKIAEAETIDELKQYVYENYFEYFL